LKKEQFNLAVELQRKVTLLNSDQTEKPMEKHNLKNNE
jgi:hypothetical protein